MRINRTMQLSIAVTVSLALGAVTAMADAINVTLDTSALSGYQTLEFSLTDGDNSADNTVTLSNFDFGGGSAVGSPSTGGGVSGDLGSSVSLTDSSFLALFKQPFDAGSSLSFTLDATHNFAGGSADAFEMYVCDEFALTCYSDDTGTDSMLILTLAHIGAGLPRATSL
jgi:hypothetical protein